MQKRWENAYVIIEAAVADHQHTAVLIAVHE